MVLSRTQPNRGAVTACSAASSLPRRASHSGPATPVSIHSSARNAQPSVCPLASTRGTRTVRERSSSASPAASAASMARASGGASFTNIGPAAAGQR